MKWQFGVVIVSAGVALTGCKEPPYRYDIRGNGQGGVDIKKVPKEPAKTVVVAAPAAPGPVVQPAAVDSAADERRHVDELEARIKALSEENEKLKQQSPPTAPATSPMKE